MFKIHISLLLNLFKANGPFEILDLNFHLCLLLLSSNDNDTHRQLDAEVSRFRPIYKNNISGGLAARPTLDVTLSSVFGPVYPTVVVTAKQHVPLGHYRSTKDTVEIEYGSLTVRDCGMEEIYVSVYGFIQGLQTQTPALYFYKCLHSTFVLFVSDPPSEHFMIED